MNRTKGCISDQARAMRIESRSPLLARLAKYANRSLAVVLCALLVFQPALVAAQSVTPDANAPAANQPGVGAAPNGVPLVDIVTPNGQGLSHNKYNSFNVGTPGAILNNHNGEVGTSNLGGVTPGNPNLRTSGPATVILNEVTSTNRSALNGPTEVFGGRADVIIANPNGITCDGCGFINTPRATLTTGTPDIGADGRLNGFTVNDGDVTFGTKGGNFASGQGGVDLFDVVSRTVRIDGPVYGKDLRLTAGRNKFGYATGEATALTATSGTPEFAIDGSALGAMQANRIKIVVTEKGAGVRMRGDMAANTGELSLSADGRISIGNASGSQGVNIRSKAKIEAGKIASKKRVVVHADKGITLQSVAADDNVELTGGSGLVSISADATTLGSFQLSSGGGISLNNVEVGGVTSLATSTGNAQIAGKVRANDLTISAMAGSITASSLVSFNNMTLSSGLDIRVENELLAAGNVVATGRSINAGNVVSGLDFAASKADPSGRTLLSAAGDLSLIANGGTVNAASLLSAGDTIVTAQKLTAQNITSRKTIAINGTTEVSGQILAATNITVVGQVIRAGSIISGVDFAATAASPGGNIVLGNTGDLKLDSTTGIISAGTLLSAGNLTTQGASIEAQAVTSHGDVAITGDINVTGQLLGANDIVINSKNIAVGTLVSGVDFNATNASPSGDIVLQGNGDLTLNAQGGAITSTTMLAAGDVIASAATIDSANITGHQNIVLNGATSVSGQILGARNVSVTGQSISAQGIVSGVDFAATNANSSGAIVLSSAGALTLDAGSGSLTAGTLLSAGDLNGSGGAIDLQNVTGHGKVALDGTAVGIGRLLGADTVNVTAGQINAQTIVSGVDFDATAQSSSGNIVLGPQGDLSLIATVGNITAASLLSAGKLSLLATQQITAGATSRQSIDMTAGGSITLSGQTLAGTDISLKATSIQLDTLVSGVDFVATDASASGSLMLKSTGNSTLDATQGSVTAINLLSGGNLSAHALENITYNSLQSFGSAYLDADQGSISIDKTTRAQGNITLETRSVNLSQNRGQIATAKSLIINADSATFAGSTYTWGGLGLNLTGNADFTGTALNAITNNGGTGNISVNAVGINTNSATALLAQNDLTLTLAFLTNPGQLAAGHDLTFNIAGDLTNTATGLVYAGNDAKLYVAGNILNDQGAIMAGHDLAIAANANNAKNQSVTNFSGLIRAENDVSIFSENLTNKRLTTPTWENVLVSDGVVSGFQMNPDILDKPYAYLVDRPLTGYQLYPGVNPPLWSDYEALLHGQATLADGTMYKAWTWTSQDGPKSAPDILDWVRDHAPKDANGNPFIDPNNPSKIVVKEIVLHPGADHSIIYTWDDASNISQSVREDRITGTLAPEALIRAGRNLNVDATTLNNSFSSIEAGGDASLKGSVLNNEGVTLNRTTTTTCNTQGVCEAYDASGNRDPSKDIAKGTSILTKVEAIGGAAGNIRAAGSMDISGFATVNNTSAPGSIAGAASLAATTGPADPMSALSGLTAGTALFTPNAAFQGLQAGSGPSAGSGPIASGSGSFAETLRVNGAALAALAKPNSGGFGGTVPGQIFLFETRAAFLDVGKFYGSGYFINRIGYKPEHEIPFLGDAYFENQLIDQQLRQLVGQGLGKGSFIPGSDAIEQMKLLLDNGIEYAKANNLKIGEQLSSEQAAALTKSVVLYQKKVVNGVEVLAPVVYLANADKANLTIAGALISGGSLNMNVGDVNNSGAIAAKTDLKLAGTNIKANGGSFKAGGNVQLAAAGNLTLNAQSLELGGQKLVNPNAGVEAGGNANLAANDNLTLQGAQVNAGGNAALSGKNVTLDVVKAENGGQQNATGAKVTAGGNIAITAHDNVNIIGSSATAGGALDVTAENGSANVVTTDVARKTDDSHVKITSTEQQESQLSSGAGTSIKAGDDILVSGSSVDAKGNVRLDAGDDVNITVAQEQATTTFGKDRLTETTHTGSQINSGGSVTITAGGSDGVNDGHDINVIGSSIEADGKVNLKAAGDVTIAEARDTSTLDYQDKKKNSGLFGSSRSTTGKLETETVVGSSIKGGEGVNIGSGADTTISASQIVAGKDNSKADINIDTGGDLTIASGTNTEAENSKSKSKGFLSKGSSSYSTYDETTIASQLDASGNVNINAGGAAVIAGSNVKAGESIRVEGDSVSIIGAPEAHELETQKKKSGLFAGSGDGFFSLWGKEQKDNQNAATLNAQSQLNAGQDVTLKARETDVNILGSGIEAKNDIALEAARDVNILPGAESMSQAEKEKRSGLGVQFSSGNGSASIGFGYGSSTDQTKQSSDTNAVSTLHAGRDLSINAGRDANLQAAQVAAERDVSIVAARDVNLLSAQDKSNYEAVHEKLFAGVSLTVSSSLLSSAASTASSAERVGGSSGTKAVSNAAIAGLRSFQALLDAQALLKKESPLASATLTAGFDYQKNKAEGSSSTPIPTVIRGGQSVTIEATSGNLTGHGVQIAAGVDENGEKTGKAGDISLSAGQDVILKSAQELTGNSSKNTSAGANIGVGGSVTLENGLKFGTGWTGDFHFGTGKETGSSVTQLNSHVAGTGDVFVQSGRDTKLLGATVSGEKVVMDVGRNLEIESQLDTASQKANQLNAGGSFAPDGSWSLSGSYQKADGDAAMVGEQSGIHAGSGGFDITVKDKTSLTGGLITSTAPQSENRLETGTLEFKDLDTHSTWKADTYGGTLSSGVPSMAPPLHEGENETGKALSAISPGQIIITDPQNQQQKLEDLRRDTLDTNTSLPGLPDLKHVLDEQYKTQADYQAAAATLAKIIGDMADKRYAEALDRKDKDAEAIWGPSGVGRAALHALGGALLGGVNDVSGAIKGALGGAISTLTGPAIRELVANIIGGTKLAGTSQGEFLINSITASLVQGIAATVGGGDAAAYAGHEFKYNYLSVSQLKDQLKEMKECADKACIDEVKAKYFALDIAQDNTVADCKDVACALFHLKAIEEAKKFLADRGYLGELDKYSSDQVMRIIANQLEGNSPAEATAQAALVDAAYCERNPGPNCKLMSRIHEAIHEGATALVVAKILNVAVRYLSPAEAAAVRAEAEATGAQLPPRTMEELLPNGKVPGLKDGAFEKWWNGLTLEEARLLAQDLKIKSDIDKRIREPGGWHEWCMVCRQEKFKELGFTMQEIKSFRTMTESLKFTDPDTGIIGNHGGTGSGKFHNELKEIIDTSHSQEDFYNAVIKLAERWKIDPKLLPGSPPN